MALYHFAVTEVRTYEMRYAIEADTLDLALEKAVIGETVAETQIRCRGVVDRHVGQQSENEDGVGDIAEQGGRSVVSR